MPPLTHPQPPNPQPLQPAPEEAYGAWNMSPSEFTGAVIALLL